MNRGRIRDNGVSYCRLDDWIPFCEYFIIAYDLWYPMLFAKLVRLITVSCQCGKKDEFLY